MRRVPLMPFLSLSLRCPGEWMPASGLLVHRVLVRGECRCDLVRRNAIGQEKPSLGNLLQNLLITVLDRLRQTHAFVRASAEHFGCSQGSLLFSIATEINALRAGSVPEPRAGAQWVKPG